MEVIVARSFLTSIFFWLLPIFEGLEIIPSQQTSLDTPFYLNIIYAVLLCGFSFFGLYFYVKSLKFEKVGVAVPVSNISSIFGVATAIVFLGEHITTIFLLAFCLAFIGVVLINNKPVKSFQLDRGVAYNLLAAFFWGVSFALFSSPVKTIGVLLFSSILESTVCVCSVILLSLEQRKFSFPIKQIDRYIIALALLGFGGVVFYNLSFLYLPVSLISLLSILTPALSIWISALLFRERLKAIQYVGIGIIIICIIILKM